MTDFTATHRIGVANFWNRRVSAFVFVAYIDGRLALTGAVAPTPHGNAACCGQIGDTLADASDWTFAPGWNAATLDRLLDVWGRWHLNDMRAGSPRQMAFLDANPVKATYPESHYEKALAALQAAGLSPDPEFLRNGKPYAYGSGWLTVPVPDTVLDFLRALPETDRPAPGVWNEARR